MNGLSVAVDNIPATLSRAVGPAVKIKAPPLNLGSTTVRTSFYVPNTSVQPDAELDPFLLEHTLQFTVHLSRMMIMKKATFIVPIRLVIPADHDDRLLNSLNPPIQWMTSKEGFGVPSRPIPTPSLHGSEASTKVSRRSENVNELSALLSLGVSTAASAPPPRKPGPGPSSKVGSIRRGSFSSQGSGGRASTRSGEPIVTGMDALLGGSSTVGTRTPHSGSYSPSVVSGNSRGTPRAGAGFGDPLLGGAAAFNPAGFLSGNPPSPASTMSMLSKSAFLPNGPAPLPMAPGMQGRSPSQFATDYRRAQQQHSPFSSPIGGGIRSPTMMQGQQQMQQMYMAGVPLQMQMQMNNGGTWGGGAAASFAAAMQQPLSSPAQAYANAAAAIMAARNNNPQFTAPDTNLSPGMLSSPTSGTTLASGTTPGAPPPQPQQQQHSLAPPLSMPNLESLSLSQNGSSTYEPPPLSETGATVSGVAAAGGGSGTTVVAKPTFKVQFAFVPTLADEVKLNVDDQVEVLEAFDDGWARGTNTASMDTGYFPIRCLLLPTTGKT
ncbi:hypothetical protein HK405_012123, partial [Cladochytrium tenue]